MDDTERMMALKRAYAETILNTAKEAAARVLASEWKSVALERDLRFAKTESLRLLLRLNQITQQKTSEAEKTAFRQQGRIEELEAQLQEAEGIIVDLREELELAHNKLKKEKSYRLQHFSGEGLKDDESIAECVTREVKSISRFEGIVPYASDLQIGPSTHSEKDRPVNNSNQNSNSSTTNKQAEPTNLSNSELICGQDSALGSSIMRNNKSELCENGCTQTIRAFERDFVNRGLSISASIEPQDAGVKSECIIVAEDKNKENCPVASNTKGNGIVKKTSKKECKLPVKGHKRRRKSYFRKSNVSSRRCRPHQLLKSFKQSTMNPKSVKLEKKLQDESMLKSDELSREKNLLGVQERLSCERVHCKDNIEVIHEGKRKQNVQTKISLFDSSNSGKSFVFSPCKYKPTNANGNCTLEKLNISEADQIQQMHHLNPELTLIKSQADSDSANVALSMNFPVKSVTVHGADDKGRKYASTFVTKEDESIQSSAVSGCALSPKKVDAEVITAANLCEEVKGSPTLADENQIVKYQRKRRRECSSNPDEESSPERSAIKKKAVEKDDASELKKGNSINDTSHGSRSVAQVARQLIPL